MKSSEEFSETVAIPLTSRGGDGVACAGGEARRGREGLARGRLKRRLPPTGGVGRKAGGVGRKGRGGGRQGGAAPLTPW